MGTGQWPRLMIVSDLDSTMVDHQDKDNTSLLRFGALWEADYRHDSVLIYNTGRSPMLYAELRGEVPLLTPGIAVMSVGTEIVYGDTMEPDLGWTEELNHGWDRDAVVEEANRLSLKFQVDSEQRPHKVSFHVEKKDVPHINEVLTEKLKARGLSVKVVYSGGLDLDVLPQGAGKGKALAYLLQKFRSENKSPAKVLVCGDSGNDADLFSVAEVYGVMVGNAHEELLQWHEKNAKGNPNIFHATERCAAGIIQAMRHFNFDTYISPRDISSKDLLRKEQVQRDETANVAHEIVEYQMYYERWLRGEVENNDDGFQRIKTALDPSCTIIFAHGVEGKPFHAIEAARADHGSMKQLRLWIDRVRINKLAEGIWAVQFDVWQRKSPEEELSCRLTSALLTLQDGTPNGLKWLQIHQTWLTGFAGKLPYPAMYGL